MYHKFIRKNFRFSIREKIKEIFTKKDPDYFKPNGSQIYFGYQGQGKTLSMVRHLNDVHKKYPKAVIISNLILNDIEYIKFESFDELQHLFKTVNNGEKGVIYAIDEIHNYFHSHDSKSIPLWLVQVFSQQRKNRVLVLGTVQMWKDITKAIRDQLENIIECKRLGPIIINHVLDPREVEKKYGEEKIKIKKVGWFIPTLSLYSKYDTLQVINSGRSIFGIPAETNQKVKIELTK